VDEEKPEKGGVAVGTKRPLTAEKSNESNKKAKTKEVNKGSV